MKITANNTTLRQALRDAISAALTHPGTTLQIDQAVGSDGLLVDSRKLQIVVRQIIPDGWELTSKKQGPHGLKIWRLE